MAPIGRRTTERCSRLGAVALGFHYAAVEFHQRTHDGQPEPQATRLSRGGGVSLPKAVDTWGRNDASMPCPVSATAISQVACSRRSRTCTRPPCSVNLIGVGDQIPDDMLESIRVSHHGGLRIEHRFNADALGMAAGRRESMEDSTMRTNSTGPTLRTSCLARCGTDRGNLR